MKVSIITATYNSAATLKDTIESILCQTYTNIDYIIIDGGSIDGTIDIIKEYEPKFSGKMKWISEHDRGIYDAMNKGIDMSSGDVVGILNSDDYFTSKDVLSKMVDAFDDQSLDAVFGDVHFIKNGNPNKVARYYSSRYFTPFWLRFGFMPAHPSFYARKRVFDMAGGYSLDYKIGSDFEMMVRLFRKYHIHYKYLQMDFVTMRMGGASTSGTSSHHTLLLEDTRACRENGIYTHPLLICMKYLYKVFEFRW